MDKEEYITRILDGLFLNMALLKVRADKLIPFFKDFYDAASLNGVLHYYLSNEINIAFLIYFADARNSLREIIESMYFEKIDIKDATYIRKSLKKCIEKLLSLEIYKKEDGLEVLLRQRILPDPNIDKEAFLRKCHANDYLVARIINGQENINSSNRYSILMSSVFYFKTVFFLDSIQDAEMCFRELLKTKDPKLKKALEFIIKAYYKSKSLDDYNKDFTPFLTSLDIYSLEKNKGTTKKKSSNNIRVF